MNNVLQAISKKGVELNKVMKDAEVSEYAHGITYLQPSEKQLVLEQEKQKLLFSWNKR